MAAGVESPSVVVVVVDADEEGEGAAGSPHPAPAVSRRATRDNVHGVTVDTSDGQEEEDDVVVPTARGKRRKAGTSRWQRTAAASCPTIDTMFAVGSKRPAAAMSGGGGRQVAPSATRRLTVIPTSPPASQGDAVHASATPVETGKPGRQRPRHGQHALIGGGDEGEGEDGATGGHVNMASSGGSSTAGSTAVPQPGRGGGNAGGKAVAFTHSKRPPGLVTAATTTPCTTMAACTSLTKGERPTLEVSLSQSTRVSTGRDGPSLPGGRSNSMRSGATLSQPGGGMAEMGDSEERADVALSHQADEGEEWRMAERHPPANGRERGVKAVAAAAAEVAKPQRAPLMLGPTGPAAPALVAPAAPAPPSSAIVAPGAGGGGGSERRRKASTAAWPAMAHGRDRTLVGGVGGSGKGEASGPIGSTARGVCGGDQMWSDKHAPTDMAQLAWHKPNIAKLSAWIHEATAWANATSTGARAGGPDTSPFTHPQRLLLLIGSPGIGKSTAVRLMAASLGVTLREWVSDGPSGGVPGFTRPTGFAPRDGRGGHYSGGGSGSEQDDGQGTVDAMLADGDRGHRWHESHRISQLPYTSALTDFKRFLGQASQVSALALVSTRTGAAAGVPPPAHHHPGAGGLPPAVSSRQGGGQLTLIEDLPWVSERDAKELQSTLLRVAQSSVHPVIIVLSEGEQPGEAVTKSSLTRMFGSEVMQHPAVSVLEVTSATALRTKAVLERILAAEQVRGMPSSLLDDIIRAAGGDIRHAILSLQFAVTHGLHRVHRPPSTATAPSSSSSNLCGRDDFFDSMRCITRLLIGKRDGGHGFARDPDATLAQCSFDVAITATFLHEHVPGVSPDVETLSRTLDAMGTSDIVGAWRGDEGYTFARYRRGGGGAGGMEAASWSDGGAVRLNQVAAAIMCRSPAAYARTAAPAPPIGALTRPVSLDVVRLARTNVAWLHPMLLYVLRRDHAAPASPGAGGGGPSSNDVISRGYMSCLSSHGDSAATLLPMAKHVWNGMMSAAPPPTRTPSDATVSELFRAATSFGALSTVDASGVRRSAIGRKGGGNGGLSMVGGWDIGIPVRVATPSSLLQAAIEAPTAMAAVGRAGDVPSAYGPGASTAVDDVVE